MDTPVIPNPPATAGKTGRRRSSKEQPESGPPAAPAQAAPRPARRAPPAPRRLWRLRLLLVCTLCVCSAVAIPLSSRLLPDFSQRPEYCITADQITLTPPPRWIPADIRQQVFEKASGSQPLSLLDDNLTERIAAAFHTHPWVEHVVRVHKLWPPRVHVDVVWRRPVAMVAGIDGFYPIDAFGVLLPAKDFAPADLKRYPVIENVASVPLGRVGEPWGDPVVELAAALAEELLAAGSDESAWWHQLQLAAILAPRRTTLDASPDELEFELRTRGGSSILWGRGPGSLNPAELSTQRKLDRLVEYTERFGPIDDAQGIWQLDIRPWQGIRRSLLAADPEPQPGRH